MEKIKLSGGKEVLIFDDLVPQSIQEVIENYCFNVIQYHYNLHTVHSELITNNHPNIKDSGQFSSLIHRNSLDGGWEHELDFYKIQNSLGTITFLPLQLFLYNVNKVFNTKKLIRLKANITHHVKGFNKEDFGFPHIDITDEENSDNVYSMLYYVNHSDGDTYLFKNDFNQWENSPEQKPLEIDHVVKYKKGRIVVFPNNILHSGSSPIDNKVRCILNYNFII